jgi:CYTH domain-containing protein
MAVEIERKFLVDAEKWQQAVKPEGTFYRQGYLLNEKGRTIRVRVTDKQAFITIKGATAGISRKEFEYEIPVADGTELLDSYAVSEIEKTRYRLYFGNKLWEVDDFMGDNAGLLIAEIELHHENEPFTSPDWITTEVSDDPRYYNSNLSKSPYKSWFK